MFSIILRVIAVVLALLIALLYHLGGPVGGNDLAALGWVAFASFFASFFPF